jgi:hypothetical protein
MVSEVTAMRQARERIEPGVPPGRESTPLRRARNTFFKLLYRYTHPRAFRHNERLGFGVRLERDAAGRLTGMSIDGQHLQCVNGIPFSARDVAQCHLIATGPSVNAIDYDALPMRRVMGVNGAIALRRKYDLRFDYYCIVDAGFVRNHGELVDLIVAEPLTLFATPTVLWHIAQRCAPSQMRCRVFLLDEMLFPAGRGALGAEQLRASYGPASLAWFGSNEAGPLGFSLDIRHGVFEGRTVAYTGLQVLASLGYRRIYLHGLDLVDAARTPRFYEQPGAMQPSHLDAHLHDVIAPSFRHAGALLRRRGVQVMNLSMVSALGEDVLPKLRWQALVQEEARESLCA